MKEDKISNLLQHYFAKINGGVEPYFDADDIEEVLEHFETEEDFKNYEDILKLGLRLHPGSVNLQIKQCKFCLLNEQYQQALNLVEAIAEVNNPEIYLIKLECYCALKQYNKAEKEIDLLIKSKYEYLEDVFEFIVPLLNDLEMIDEAIHTIKKGLRIYPDNTVMKDELSYSLESKGKYKEAIKLYNELLDEDPYSYNYWFALGRLYSFTSEYNDAIESLSFAETCSDDFNTEQKEELKVLKAYCFFMNENYEKAIEAYREILDDSDESVNDRIKSLIAECYTKLEDFERAFQTLRGIIDKNTNDSFTYLNYIRCSMETDRGHEASRILHKAAGLFPDNVRILTLLALSDIGSGTEIQLLPVAEKIVKYLCEAELQEEDCTYNISAIKELLPDGKFVVKHDPVPADELINEFLCNPNHRN